MLLVEDTWKAASHGKNKAAVLEVSLTSSNVSNENVMKSFVVPVPNCVPYLHRDWSMANSSIMKKFDLFWMVEGVQTKTLRLEKMQTYEMACLIGSWQ